MRTGVVMAGTNATYADMSGSVELVSILHVGARLSGRDGRWVRDMCRLRRVLTKPRLVTAWPHGHGNQSSQIICAAGCRGCVSLCLRRSQDGGIRMGWMMNKRIHGRVKDLADTGWAGGLHGDRAAQHLSSVPLPLTAGGRGTCRTEGVLAVMAGRGQSKTRRRAHRL